MTVAVYVKWPKGSSDKVRQRGHFSPLSRSIPSHHFVAVWNSADSRWRLRPGDGTTESQEATWGDVTDSSCALFGSEEDSKSARN